MAFDDWRRFGRYPPRSRTRTVEGGIRANAQRGQFAQSWWGKRWIAVLESFEIGSRLQRGRNYARKGQVLSIDIGKGHVNARVQGSRPTPYEVQIKVRTLTIPEWKRLATQLSKQAIYAARLLAGEMPQDIEAAFTTAGLSLFPAKLNDISTYCSCPDWSNPCKHVAAVYYLLGEAFDRDPFLIFRFRGIEREDFLPMLGHDTGPAADDAAVPAAEPLPSAASEFWGMKEVNTDLFADVDASRPPAALVRRLGSLQFWRGHQPLVAALEPTYERAAKRGGAIAAGEIPENS